MDDSSIPPGLDLQASKQSELIVGLTVPAAIVIVAVTCRFISRKLSKASLWWDDWVMLGTFVLWLASFSSEEAGNFSGAGRHFLSLTPAQMGQMGKITYVNEVLWAPLVGAVKSAILCLYLRLFHVNRRFAKVCYVVLGISIAWAFATTFAFIFQCTPVEAGWEPILVQEGKATCVNTIKLFLSTAVLHIILDITILVLPLQQIWALKLNRGKKIATSAIFLLGAFTTAVSIVRLYYIVVLDPTDFTWNYVPLYIWQPLEVDVAIICACLPVMAPLVRLIFHKRFGLSSFSRSSDYQSHKRREGHSANEFSRLDNDDTKLVRSRSPGGDVALQSIYVKHDIHINSTSRSSPENPV